MRDHSGFGWLALIVSILLVLLGIATFIWPEAALESFSDGLWRTCRGHGNHGHCVLCARGAPYGLRPDDGARWYSEA